MSPDRRARKRSRKKSKKTTTHEVPVAPSSDDAHEVVYFRRHVRDDSEQSVPGRTFLREICPPKVRATMAAVLVAVAAAPPKRYSGGGYWEAMKSDMTGWFEVRVNGPKRHHYRLFCLLDYEAKNKDRSKPLLVVITGLDKPFSTTLAEADYARVRKLGAEYLSRNPRSIV